MFCWMDFTALERSRFFWASRERGEYQCGNPQSFYLRGADPEKASFDTGNNKVITVSGLNGELRKLTIFKESYFADNIPGVWVHKGRVLAGPFSFGLKRDGAELRLPDFEGPIRTELVECVIPLTSYALNGLNAQVAAFAPISEDGARRPRGAFYILSLENTSDAPQKGDVLPPGLGHFSQVMDEGGDRPQIDIQLADGMTRATSVAFDLAPGERRLFPVWLSVYGQPLDPGLKRGALYWLEQTLRYYRSLAGGLSFEGDEFLSEFVLRTLHQCQQCIGMDAEGVIAGSSWGTNPTTHQIWMKDMYYSMLPLARTDPELFWKGALWFARYGVRPEGTLFPGGVTHSLSNSLSSVLMAGQYYALTGDWRRFREDPALVEALTRVLDEMILSRTRPDVWLFPSTWISDGLSMGDFHTGSNITAWAALRSFARVLDALDRAEKAETYRAVADKVRQAILTLCVTDEGPYGPQLMEGVGKGPEELQRQMKADSLEEFKRKNNAFGVQFYEFYNHTGDGPYLVHDGEETDTTLASFYGLLAFDEPVFKNYTRFAMTEHNRFYCPVSKGILWEDCTDSTFPGYVTGMANAVDAESFGRYFSRIRELADLDGSIWWWPYPHQTADHSVMRRDPGKCGWASGALLALIWHDLMGVRYDGARRVLELKPLDAPGGFRWRNAPLGHARFDIEYKDGTLRVTNHNAHAVTLNAQLFGNALSVGRKSIPCTACTYFGKPARAASLQLLPGESVEVRAKD